MTPIKEFANALLRDPRRATDDIHQIHIGVIPN